MIAAHAEAVLGLLDADNGPPPLVVFDGAIPDKPQAPPYALVYFSAARPEAPESGSLVGESTRFVLRATVHCVGANQTASRAVAQRVSAALLDVAPAVVGRKCHPIRHETGRQADRDETTGALVVDWVDVYRLESIPAQ